MLLALVTVTSGSELTVGTALVVRTSTETMSVFEPMIAVTIVELAFSETISEEIVVERVPNVELVSAYLALNDLSAI